jgi:hypothetical protein
MLLGPHGSITTLFYGPREYSAGLYVWYFFSGLKIMPYVRALDFRTDIIEYYKQKWT